ncbi:MAG: hypothetical protein ACRD88_04235, partial [Terriglobia bacterium]
MRDGYGYRGRRRTTGRQNTGTADTAPGERKGWTAKALGRKAGDYDRSTISCIETGHGKCSLQLIQG